MLPVESFRIMRAHHLECGQFALLHDFNHTPVLVGQIKEFTLAVLLEADFGRSNTIDVSDLTGAATTVDKFRFDGDFRNVGKVELMRSPINSLAIKGAELFILAVPPSNFGNVPVKLRDLPHENSGVTYGISDWRVVHEVGDREVELFSREAPRLA